MPALLQLMSDLQENGWTLPDLQLVCQMWQHSECGSMSPGGSYAANEPSSPRTPEPSSPRKRRASKQLKALAAAAFSSSKRKVKAPSSELQLTVEEPSFFSDATPVSSPVETRQNGERLKKEFEFVVGSGELGRGALSVVKRVVHRRSGKSFACKCIDKDQLTSKARQALLTETSLMRELDHPNIVKLWHCYEDVRHHYIVMDLIEGGELFDRIVAKEMYNEREARDLVRTLLDVLGYLHYEARVVHRDIKPENILCVSLDNDTKIKLCDFGFAAKIDQAEPHTCLSKVCGTPQYVAPEILRRKPYGAAVDMWSCGVVTYILLSGYAPFSEQPNLNFNICSGNFSFHPDSWDHVSAEGKEFISQLLTLDPSSRMTADEALVHPWIAEDGALLENHDLHQNLTRLKSFNASNKFKAAARTVIAAARLANGNVSWTRPYEEEGRAHKEDLVKANEITATE